MLTVELFGGFESHTLAFQSLPQDLLCDSAAQLPIHGIPDLSDFLFVWHQLSLWHYFVVVLLVEVLFLFVEVVQFLVQRLIGQLGILQTSLNIAVFPEPILSGADVVHRIVDFVVA